MSVRLMRTEDCVPVAAVLNHAIDRGVAHFGTIATTPDEVRRHWRASQRLLPWLVACDKDESFMGFARASRWKTRQAYDWTIETGIYVVEHAQGRGVGRSLYARLLALLRAQGYRVVLASVSVPNPASERLHESVGFTPVGDIAPGGYKHGRWVGLRLYHAWFAGDTPPGEILPVASVWHASQEHQNT